MTDILRSLWADARPWLLGLLFGWVLAACLSSCTAPRQATQPTPTVPPVALDTAAVTPPALPTSPAQPWPNAVYGATDSSSTTGPKKAVSGGLFHRKKARKPQGGQFSPGPSQSTSNLRKCKGCTFINAGGNVSTAAKNAAAGPGATAAAKASSPVAGWDAVAQDYTKQGGKGGTVASGAGSAATAPPAAEHKQDWLSWLFHRWWFYVVAAGLVLVLLWPLIGPSLLLLLGVAGRALAQGLAWFIALFKRRQQPVAAVPVAPAPETPPTPSPLPVAVATPVAPAPVVAAETVVYPVTPASPIA